MESNNRIFELINYLQACDSNATNFIFPFQELQVCFVTLNEYGSPGFAIVIVCPGMRNGGTSIYRNENCDQATNYSLNVRNKLDFDSI